MPKDVVAATILNQDPLAKDLIFPLNTAETLTEQDYLDYFEGLQALMAKSGLICESLTLKLANSTAISALKTYLLKESSLLFFKKLILVDTSKGDSKAIPSLLKVAENKGLASLELTNTKLDAETASDLHFELVSSSLTIDILLPKELSKIQGLLDEACSKNQRKKRIEDFGKEAKVASSTIAKTFHKRKRKIALQARKKIAIDTDTEVQVDIQVDTAIESTLEEQMDDKEVPEFIDRDIFLDQIKNSKFKTQLRAKKAADTWDCWMGNISQLVVKPNPERMKTRIEVVTSENEIKNNLDKLGEFENQFTFYIIQPKPGELPIGLKKVYRTSGPSVKSSSSSKTYLPQNINLKKFLKNIYPESTSYNYLSKDISDKEWDAIKSTLGSYSDLPKLYQKNRRKNNYTIDATLVETESLVNLEKISSLTFDNHTLVKRLYPNQKIPCMTRAACEKLLEYSSQLQFGIDFEHLPPGFELKEIVYKGTQVKALFYSDLKARLSKQDPFSLKFIPPNTPLPLSADLMELWLNLPKTAAKDKLKKIYLSLLDPYDRNKVREFKQYLPAMLYLSLAEVTIFEDTLAAAKKLKNQLHIQSTNLQDHLLYKFLEKCAEKEGLNLLADWHKILNFSIADLNSLLGIYNEFGIKGLNSFFKTLEKARIPLSQNKMDDSLLLSLKSNYFLYCESFLPCLDPKFELALTIIKSFSTEERHLFEDLFKQHAEAVGYDDLYNIARAFQNFKEKIKDKGLVFPKFPTFKKIKSLPVALSRILAILDATPLQDLELVWQGMAGIDLQSNGAIKVITDADPLPHTGVLTVSEMQMEACHYKKTHDFATKKWYKKNIAAPDHGYQALKITRKNPKDLELLEWLETLNFQSIDGLEAFFANSKDQVELERNYYRFIGAKIDRKSLDFYRKAQAKIDKEFSDFQTRAAFYAIIAKATSSLEANLDDKTEVELLSLLPNIIADYNKITFPIICIAIDSQIRLAALDAIITGISYMPPLPIFSQILHTLVPVFTVSSGDLTQAITGSDLINERYDKFLKAFHCKDYLKNKNNFFEGLKFFKYTESALDDLEKFSYIATRLIKYKAYDIGYEGYKAEKHDQLWVGQYVSHQFADAFVSLISTFNLKEDLLNLLEQTPWFLLGVTTSVDQHHFVRLINNSLKLLTKVKTNTNSSGKVLKQEDLLDLMNDLYALYKAKPDLDISQTSLALVQQKFAEFFEADFFTKLSKSEGLPLEIQSLIQKNFTILEEQNLVSEILLNFTRVEDYFHRENTLKVLAKITTKLTDLEKKLFLKNLSTINANQVSSLEDLYNLLLAVGEKSKTSDFLFIIDHYSTEPKRTISQMLLYFQEAIPILYAKTYENLKLVELQPLAASLLLYVKKGDFADKFKELLKLLEPLAKNFPTVKTGVLALLSSFIYQVKDDPAFDVVKFMNYLAAANIDTNGDILCSLCDHYLAKPLELYKVFEELESIDKSNQNLSLQIISSLANNGENTELSDIKKFISQGETNPEVYQAATSFFKAPPYPILSKLTDWNEKALKPGASYPEIIQKSYEAYELEPCPPEADNGYNFKEAKNRYAQQFKGVDFSDEDLEELDKKVKKARTKTVKKLQETLNSLKALSPDELSKNHAKLLATLAELLYRSKGSAGGPGLSFELNTVQYLAILAYLKTGEHVTAEMATGEGKSRTMMLATACEFAMSKTVDFVTSDMQLAQRDYLEYQAFFKILGAETSLIHSTSAFSSYKKGGINFSDASNLSLFRNKARSSGKASMVIDKDPKKRALILDEADKTYFDISETKFNYSDLPKDSKIKDMEWVYPFLVRFFTQNNNNATADIDDTEAFIDFIKADSNFKEEMLIQLKALPQSQLESWLDAAVDALSLKLGEDYTIEPNILVETTKGPKPASEARLIYNSSISKNAKFSFGVHQCLHAFLNDELKKPNSATSLKVKVLLEKQGKANFAALPFQIQSEKQIVYSSTSKSFLDDYKEGDVWAITGTAGSIIEKEEAALFHSKGFNSSSLMKFVSIPRREGLKREDKPIRITKNFSKRVEATLEYIIEAQEKGRPSLVICENDREAEELNKALQALAKTRTKILPSSWQFVDATTSEKEASDKISKAGEPSMITISTSRLGRGTDIKLKEASRKAGGLRVIATFLPRERDQNQIFGRGGRYKDTGDARIVADRMQLKRFFGKSNIDSKLFLSTEFFIKYNQAMADKIAQSERLLRNSLSDFRQKITDAFFNFYDALPPEDLEKNKKLIDFWSECTKKIDYIWSQAWPDLQDILQKPKIDIKAINARLEQFKIEAETPWDILQQSLGEGALKALDAVRLSPETEYLLKFITPKRRYSLSDRTQVYKVYDKALDGRAVIYDELFTEFKSLYSGERLLFANIRAWWEGNGILFANTRALLAGHRPLFANLRAWMAKDTKSKQQLQIQCKTIEEALEKHDHLSLQHFIQEQSAAEFLGPDKPGSDLSLRMQIIESILSYAHQSYESRSKLSTEEMDEIKELLTVIKDSKSDELETKLSQQVAKLHSSFFSPSLKKEVEKVMVEYKLNI